jgi:hypothetical protein
VVHHVRWTYLVMVLDSGVLPCNCCVAAAVQSPVLVIKLEWLMCKIAKITGNSNKQLYSACEAGDRLCGKRQARLYGAGQVTCLRQAGPAGPLVTR